MRITMNQVKEHGKEIAIGVLLLALVAITLVSDRGEGKLREHEAAQQRQENIEQAQAGRKEVQDRERNLYPSLDQGATEIKTRQQAIKKAAEAVPSLTRKEIEDAIKRTTEGDSDRLADLYRAGGYPCTVVER